MGDGGPLSLGGLSPLDGRVLLGGGLSPLEYRLEARWLLSR